MSARGRNKTSALLSIAPEEQTRLRRCRACRPRNKQDFGVAEHAARGTNKTAALPSMPPEEQTRLRRCRACRVRPRAIILTVLLGGSLDMRNRFAQTFL